MKALRITGKAIEFVLAVILIFQAIAIFNGAQMNPVALGVQLIFLSVIAVESALTTFKKPKHITAEVVLHFKDGTVFRVRPKGNARNTTVELAIKPLESIDANVIEVDEDE